MSVRECAVLSQGSWVQSFTQSRSPSVGTSGRQPEEFLGKRPVIHGITANSHMSLLTSSR